MDKHVTEVSRTCFYHLRALRHNRSAITAEDANIIARSVVGSRLDYASGQRSAVRRIIEEHHPSSAHSKRAGSLRSR